jgi:hypothetical protein
MDQIVLKADFCSSDFLARRASWRSSGATQLGFSAGFGQFFSHLSFD